MARAAKLKVFRTPIGFHDAYVAAPSQKAALAAWGSDHNLFARGEAELVSDPALTAAPLADPGKVVKRLRGSADEQFAALGPDRRETKAKKAPAAAKPRRHAPPRPDRAPLDRAEEALKQAQTQHKEELDRLIEEENRIAQRRRGLERKQEAEQARLEDKLTALRAAYQRKLDAWRAG